MQVNSISNLLQLNELQALTGSGSASSTDNTASSFASLLQGMLQNTQGTTSMDNLLPTGDSSVASGISSLSVDPQKLAQMLQLQSMQNMLTSTSSTDSDNSDNSDGDSDDSASIMPDTTNEMSQMYSYILEALSQNSNQTENSAQASTDSSQLVNASANTSSTTSAHS